MPATSFTTGASTALLLLTATVVTTLFMLHGDSIQLWSRTAEHPPNSHSALLRLPNQATEERSLVGPHQNQRRTQENPPPPPQQEIRYVAFGTSTTWGAGLLNPETDTYPKLLSPNAVNLAIRASGPGSLAMCMMTMLEHAAPDAMYDVILIEYYHRTRDEVDINPFYNAVARLRKRFPDALIVFVRDWYLNGLISYADKSLGRWVDIEEWNKMDGNELPIHSEEYKNKFVQSVQQGIEWTWSEGMKERDHNLFEIASSVNGRIVNLSRPDNVLDFPPYRYFFADDGHHLSNEGHKDIARRVSRLVKTVGIHPNPRLGSWDETGRDVCVSWYTTGECPLPYSGEGVRMDNWFARKFALTFPFGHMDGVISFTNPTSTLMDLYMDYMSNGPLPGYYPLTEIIVESQWDGVAPVQIKRVYIDPSEPYSVHVVKPAFIATLPPGPYILRIRPVEPNKEHPFRIVGINLSDPSNRFNTPEVHIVEPNDCVDVLDLRDPSAAPPLGSKLSLFHYMDPKTTEVKKKKKGHERTTNHEKIESYVCDNVYNSNA